MKKIVKLALTAAAVLIAVVGLVACSSGSKKSDFSESGKEKVFYLSGFLQGTGDRIPYVWQNGDGLVPYLLYRTLLMADSKYEKSTPDLAKDWKKSDDEKTYEFTLKDGLKWSDGEALTASDPVTSGMYKVKEISAGNFLEYDKNENYENEKPKFDKVVFNYISDPVLALQDGKSYFYSTNKPQEISQLDAVSTLSKKPIDILFYRYFIANLAGVEGNGDSLIANPKVREAILYAINRDELAKSVFSGIADVNNTGVPSSLEAHLKSANKFEYNPEKAKQLLKEAKYDNSRNLILAYYYKDQASQDFMQAVSYQLNEVGIKNEVVQITSDATTGLFKTRKYDLAYKGLSSFGYETWYGEYSSTNTNFKNITNGETSFDELSKKLSETSDVKERNKILASLQKLEQEKLLKLNLFTFKNFLYLNTEKVLIPDDVQFGNPFYKFDYKFEKWDAK
ncbi:oligopeptide ABC transporter,oligopeptide-binding protein [Streptococcus pneumoniae]|uniref:ABC transporter substrate-binding protein n=1 Tax=Streptococcus pneumoniae TaxID=1313 RepID=UPI0005E3918B|nr:ABC transporter substrate-binding protein [Streptococcus pneumoniae]CTK58644.1 oligopeptide ABC transporter,oligopeptide-binding protein [Streptococcus pneumoniae]CTK90208.1 oligopeptide ABC transporter,oligopeptide-binding protein [Streptococcus pneumoniae]